MKGAMTLRSQTHKVTPPGTFLQIVVVGYGPYCLGLPADTIRGIKQPEEMDADGSVTLLGNTYSRIDLPQEFGLTRHPTTSEARVILCGRGSVCIAIGVDRVFGLQELDSQALRPLPPHFRGSERDWFAGLFRFQQQVALSINPDWLLQDERASRPLSVTGENRFSPAEVSQNSSQAAGQGRG